MAFDGAPLAARQRITKLRVLSWEPHVLLNPAMVTPLAALLPALRALHLAAHIRPGDGASGADLHALYAALAAGAPRLEELTLPDPMWLGGVEALAGGLKRLAVKPPGCENTTGWLTLEHAAALGKLQALESLELDGVIGLRADDGPDALVVGALPLFEVLRSLPGSMQCLHVPLYFYPSNECLSLSAKFGSSVDTGSGANGNGSAKTYLNELAFGGPFVALAMSAMELLKGGRLPPRVPRLHISQLFLDREPLEAHNMEQALGNLVQRCDVLELDELHVRVAKAPEGVAPGGTQQLLWAVQAQAPGLQAAFQAMRLLGVPRKVLLVFNQRMQSLEVNTSALTMTRPRPQATHAPLVDGANVRPRLPDPAAFLCAIVRDVAEEHRGTPVEDEDEATRRDPAVLLVQGGFVDALPRDPDGLCARLKEMMPPEPAAEDDWRRGRCEALVLPPASALLLRLRKGVSPAAVVTALEEAARGVALDLAVVRLGRTLSHGLSTLLKTLSERALQSTLDAAAPHLTAMCCLDWLYGMGQALRALHKPLITFT
ncbi:hypothetical protein HYH03_004616 [Edaphochlamys debaryana]|uniref:Uncharacterized protein n=1 Tax=Edaphochlamys debaryana TaxID=47281 RepID=A0A835Y7G8_9CHLO|nr:hypothetical protein HYH03_004616 [Edaphochlamys debaryana]|eukprot:KAG2497461.1 hypothetical protein HYH03_004616 [Edaphochlamys debaryana]